MTEFNKLRDELHDKITSLIFNYVCIANEIKHTNLKIPAKEELDDMLKLTWRLEDELCCAEKAMELCLDISDKMKPVVYPLFDPDKIDPIKELDIAHAHNIAQK